MLVGWVGGHLRILSGWRSKEAVLLDSTATERTRLRKRLALLGLRADAIVKIRKEKP
jgi:hypothetical protein